ncbi:osmotically-inducible protein OsmY [Methylorubrum rhodinum]|uniref:Osmotically-inducible protein OsmY n=1 Tax=Methylorubrum rhodinum TaxID=29428 RepID=A0A840ZQ54_9HYPH|nr:BON domain-containing protein [Methylorubrum rhodinum]MBB5759007.1 osmotically-inducible protein OsmY [Methylorubrum rhodinum]
MDDKTLRLHRVEELDFLPQLDAARIGVAVADGVVSLTGHVATYGEKLAAERAVLQVRAVVERIEVSSPDHLRVGDEELADRCARVIEGDATVPHGSVVVKIENGCITLTGWVERYEQKDAADRALRRLVGVTDIVNTVGVRHPTPVEAAPVRDEAWSVLY